MNTIWLIAGGIIFLGFIIFLFLILKARKKHKAIKHYEELRDKLSIREAEEATNITEEVCQAYEGFSLGNLMGGFIVLFVGVTLLPIITEELDIVKESGELVGASATMIEFVPIIFAGMLILTALGIASSSLRKIGLM